MFRNAAAKNEERKKNPAEPTINVQTEENRKHVPIKKEKALEKWMRTKSQNSIIPISENKNAIECLISPRKTEHSKSPNKKQRGRPPKSTNFTRKPSNADIKCSDISQMFKAQKKEVTKKKIPDLDYEVFMELPEFLRDEILRDYDLQNLTNLESSEAEKGEKFTKQSESIIVDKKFLELLDPQLRMEVEKVIDSKDVIVLNDSNEELEEKKNVTDNVFLKNEWRQLLKSWLEFNKPNVKDVEVLVASAIELIEFRKINFLFNAMKFLFRSIKVTKNCKWHQVYFMILTPIQTKIKSIFKSKLLLESKFNCDFCD
jgi:hypothetical protein